MNSPVYIQRTASIHPFDGKQRPYLAAGEPDYKTAVPYPAARRRMSRIIKMGVACALQCLEGVRPEKVNALITATGIGCLGDTEKFLEALIRQHEEMLNPTPFIQSTFNTIGGQIALLLHIQTYNVTYVHRGLSFESALLDGMMHVTEGHDNVLVEAVDELTPTQFALMQRLGMTRHGILGEGAQAFLLGREKTEQTLAEVLDCAPYTTLDTPTAELVSHQLTDILARAQKKPEDIRLWVNGSEATGEERIFSNGIRQVLGMLLPQHNFKTMCGEYPTASAYGVYSAIEQLQSLPSGSLVLVSNLYAGRQYSFTLLRHP